jgi:hypothetical protein
VNQAKISDRLPAFALIFVSAIVLFPLLLVSIPPLMDFPNHLARLWLISGGAEDPVVSHIYKIDWNVSWSNILIDLIAFLFGPLFSIEWLGKIVAAIALLLPPFGVAILNRAVFGKFHWWNILCFILCWNWIYVAGFMNFEISLGLALLFSAVEYQSMPKGLLFFLRLLFSVVLLVAHPFGLLFYAFLLGGIAIGPKITRLRSASEVMKIGWQLVPCAVAVILPLVVFFAFGPKLPGSAAATPSVVIWNPLTLKSLGSVLTTYFKTYDRGYDLIFVAGFALVIGIAAILGRLRLHAGLFAVAILLGFFSLFVPSYVLATAWVDTRLPAMAALTLAASVRPDFANSSVLRLGLVCVSLAFVALRTAYVAHIWNAATKDMNAVSAAISGVQPGSAVLPVHDAMSADVASHAPIGRVYNNTKVYWHYASLVVIDRHSFIPTLFSAVGKQPLRVLPPWSEIAVPEGNMPSVDMLSAPATAEFPYLTNWRTRFDYVLVLNADMPNERGPLSPDLPLQLVSDQGFAKLYKIVK